MGSVPSNFDISKFLAPDAQRADLENKVLNRSYMKMLEEGLLADITLKAHGGSVKAHRCVLASASPVFNAMFQHEMKEQLTSTVELLEMTIEGLQFFMLLLYIVPHNVIILREFQGAVDKHFNEIFEACQKYQVTKLVSTLNDALPRNLTPENCWDCLIKSFTISRFCDLCPHTPRYCNPAYICADYIMDNCAEVMKSERVLQEMKQNPELVRAIVKSLSRLLMSLLPKNRDDSTPSVSSLWNKYKRARTG